MSPKGYRIVLECDDGNRYTRHVAWPKKMFKDGWRQHNVQAILDELQRRAVVLLNNHARHINKCVGSPVIGPYTFSNTRIVEYGRFVIPS